MPIPIFEPSTDVKHIPSAPPADRKVSGVAIFFSVVLVAILIFTMELALRDVNRLFNSQYDACYQKKSAYTLFRSLTPNELCEMEKYDGIRLLLHTDIIIPVILISVFLLYIYRRKNLTGYLKVLHAAYIFFILWIGIRIIGETEYFLMKHHPLCGKYVILISIITLFIFLIIYIQRRFQSQP